MIHLVSNIKKQTLKSTFTCFNILKISTIDYIFIQLEVKQRKLKLTSQKIKSKGKLLKKPIQSFDNTHVSYGSSCPCCST